MTSVESDQIRAFLSELGDRHPVSAQLYLLGGSALCLLGSPRPTLDIDYIGDDVKKDDLQKAIDEVALEMGLDVEAVPLERFIPLPAGGRARSLHFETFAKIDVYIFDPYSIALSKIDRGFDTDIDDVIFLIRRGLVDIEELERITREALSHALEFDMNPPEVLAHLRSVHDRLK